MSKKINKKFSKEDIHRIIEMAWEDRTTFESIEKQFGINQDEVIKIMRKELSPNSFKNWRKRVSGRKAKHRKLNELRNDHSLL